MFSLELRVSEVYIAIHSYRGNIPFALGVGGACLIVYVVHRMYRGRFANILATAAFITTNNTFYVYVNTFKNVLTLI